MLNARVEYLAFVAPTPPRVVRPKRISVFYLPPRPLALALLTVARPLARPTPRPRAFRLLNMGAFLETRVGTLVTETACVAIALFWVFRWGGGVGVPLHTVTCLAR